MTNPSGTPSKYNASSKQVCVRLDNATVKWIDSIVPNLDLNRSDRIRTVLDWAMGFMDQCDMEEVYEKGFFDPEPAPYSINVLNLMIARTEHEIKTHEVAVEALDEELRRVANGVSRLEKRLQDKLKHRDAET